MACFVAAERSAAPPACTQTRADWGRAAAAWPWRFAAWLCSAAVSSRSVAERAIVATALVATRSSRHPGRVWSSSSAATAALIVAPVAAPVTALVIAPAGGRCGACGAEEGTVVDGQADPGREGVRR